MNDPVLVVARLAGVVKHYGRLTALEGANLQLRLTASYYPTLRMVPSWRPRDRPRTNAGGVV